MNTIMNALETISNSNAVSQETAIILYGIIGIVVVVVFVKFFSSVVTGKF